MRRFHATSTDGRSSLTSGARSHKRITKEQSRILWAYYHDTRVLFTVCAMNETFFVCLYLMKWYTKPIGLDPTFWLGPLPLALVKQLPPSTYWIIRKLTWPHIVALLTFPICAFKQVLNVIQIVKAANALNDTDITEMRARGRAK